MAKLSTTLNGTFKSDADASNITSALSEVLNVHALLAAALGQLGGNQLVQDLISDALNITNERPQSHGVGMILSNNLPIFMSIQPILDTSLPFSFP